MILLLLIGERGMEGRVREEREERYAHE